jgi:hypothetical protein
MRWRQPRPIARHAFLSLVCLAAGAGSVFAQAPPTSQPKLVQIYSKQITTGHAAAHTKTEAGWPAAFAKSPSPDHLLALAGLPDLGVSGRSG